MKNFCARMAVLAAAILAGPAFADGPATNAAQVTKAGIIISKETTFIDGPIREDGTIDYIAAYNALASKGVTKENNAGALIARVAPRYWPNDNRRDAMLAALDTASAKDDPEIVGFENFLSAKGVKQEEISKKIGLIDIAIRERVFDEKESPEFAAWIASQKKALDLLVEASQRERMFIPLVPSEKMRSLIEVDACPTFLTSACIALQMRANLRLAASDFEGARADMKAAMRLGRMVRTMPLSMQVLVGQSIEMRALWQYRTWASCEKLTREQIAAILSDIASLPVVGGRENQFGERFYVLDWAMEIRAGRAEQLMRNMMAMVDEKAKPPMGNLVEVDANVLLRAGNKYFDNYCEIAAIESYRKRREAIAAQIALFKDSDVPKLGAYELVDSIARFVDPASAPASQPAKPTVAEYLVRKEKETVAEYSNRVARLFFEQPTDAGSMFNSISVLNAESKQMTLTVMALLIYKLENGEYPAKLEALVPKYLAKMPVDLFSDEAPKYRKIGAGYLLYSVGPNLKDDGGKRKADNPEADDFAVSVNLPINVAPPPPTPAP